MTPRRKPALPKTKTPGQWAAFFRCINARYPIGARNPALLRLAYCGGIEGPRDALA